MDDLDCKLVHFIYKATELLQVWSSMQHVAINTAGQGYSPIYKLYTKVLKGILAETKGTVVEPFWSKNGYNSCNLHVHATILVQQSTDKWVWIFKKQVWILETRSENGYWKIIYFGLKYNMARFGGSSPANCHKKF